VFFFFFFFLKNFLTDDPKAIRSKMPQGGFYQFFFKPICNVYF